MIAIIDYGMGNLFSVSQALQRLGHEYKITSNPSEILTAEKIILPGVGAFGDAIENLFNLGLTNVLQKAVQQKIPILGICLGMQLLFEESEEHGLYEGLGFLPGRVIKFSGDFKIPHMGWNKLSFKNTSALIHNLNEGFAYFVHSYYVETQQKDLIIADTDYFGIVPAIVGQGLVFGMQFHPEKSGELGMHLLNNFCEMVDKGGEK